MLVAVAIDRVSSRRRQSGRESAVGRSAGRAAAIDRTRCRTTAGKSTASSENSPHPWWPIRGPSRRRSRASSTAGERWRCSSRWSRGGACRSAWHIARRAVRRRPSPSGASRSRPSCGDSGKRCRSRCIPPGDQRVTPPRWDTETCPGHTVCGLSAISGRRTCGSLPKRLAISARWWRGCIGAFCRLFVVRWWVAGGREPQFYQERGEGERGRGPGKGAPPLGGQTRIRPWSHKNSPACNDTGIRVSPEGKRGQAPLVRSTLRAVPANGACPLFV